MKLKIVFWVFLCLIIVSIVGCSKEKKENNQYLNLDTTPTDSATYSFSTIDELVAAFIVDENVKGIAMENSELYGRQYYEFIQKIAGGEYPTKTLYLNGQEIEFRSREGYSNITLFTKDLYSRPWIWYHCVINNLDCTIKIMYLSPDEIAYASSHSMAQIMKYISPKAPNIDNIDKYSSYSAIYEEEIAIENRKVSSLCYELKGDKRIHRSFIYDDVFVMITAEKKINNSEILAGFGMNTAKNNITK